MIVVVGERGGVEETSFVLEHGADPVRGLVERGWVAGAVVADGAPEDLVLRYEVSAADPPRATGSGPLLRPPLATGATEADRAAARRRRRVAAYAVVVESGALLLTRLAPRTGAAGDWTLPGGGVDAGEEPVAAVHREVAEETGQSLSEVRLVGVMTAHWVGVSERGPEENHAVRLLHTARCTSPTRPVVHDVGGSTTEARWVPLTEVAGYRLVPTVPVALAATGHGWAHPNAQS